jgi:hypothetical protein
MTQNNETKTPIVAEQSKKSRPNDTGSINVQGFIKIFDPVNKEVFVEKQA